MIKQINCNKKNYLDNLTKFLDLRRSSKKPENKIISKILSDIKKNKNKALIKYEKKFSKNSQIKPSIKEINNAIKFLDPKIKKAIDFALKRIFNFHIKQKKKNIYYKESLDLFDDGMEKYKFLIDQAKNAKNFPEEYRNETFKVSGCQAQVWLVPIHKDHKLSFYYDSDAFISKGMVTILCDIYGDRNPVEIQNSDFNMLNILELDTLLTPGRRNGVYSMLEKIKEYAKSYSNN